MIGTVMNEQFTIDQDSVNQTRSGKLNKTFEKQDLVTFQNRINVIKLDRSN